MYGKNLFEHGADVTKLIFLLTANAFSHKSEPYSYSNKRIQNIQCCGSGMFNPNPNFFHPGSAWKNLSFLTQNIFSKLSEIRSGLFHPGFGFFTHPGPGVKKAPDPGSATLHVYRWMNIFRSYSGWLANMNMAGNTPPTINQCTWTVKTEHPNRIRYCMWDSSLKKI